MAGKTKPKRRRQVRELCSPIGLAVNSATRLTAAERDSVLEPLVAGLEAFRTGRATSQDWMNLVVATSVALCIEEQGVVRGLREPLHRADVILAQIEGRATAGGPWRSPTLYGHELIALQELVRFHAFQIEQLSAAEFQRAVRLSIARYRQRAAQARKAPASA